MRKFSVFFSYRFHENTSSLEENKFSVKTVGVTFALRNLITRKPKGFKTEKPLNLHYRK